MSFRASFFAFPAFVCLSYIPTSKNISGSTVTLLIQNTFMRGNNLLSYSLNSVILYSNEKEKLTLVI